MAWTLLAIAGLLEIAFAFCMKSSEGFSRLLPSVGTGYAVWTGIGAAGTAIVGMALLGDAVAPLRIACIALILAGVVGLKLVT